MKHLTIDPSASIAPTRDLPSGKKLPESLPEAKETKLHPSNAGGENASLLFVGTATTILEWEGIRLMTDPNMKTKSFRSTNSDHFDAQVEASLRRDLPIITTPHAKEHLATSKEPGEAFKAVHDLDFFDDILVDIQNSGKGGKKPAIKVTGMPGKHVPPGPGGVMGKMNDLLAAVPPTNGWMMELGYHAEGSSDDFQCGYRIYISGDTLLVPELQEIPKRYPHVDLMLVHLGGTTIPSPSVPLLMVTMDAEQGLKLVQMIGPDLTIPIHYDDYDVFLSPLSDFKKAMDEAGLGDKVVYLDRKDSYRFKVKDEA
ncbi:hypothetical protein OEA41_003314 [Lepraria neglecta]|uniref:Metallo-beta-lactamase domain-containing protein n=1 Tax=Lepraria neglecta TaxID=209136 RepID=A0AAD9Z446_9LECA|nr:hypothetical protein OEA41_003314 [Lepraria neglecta]